MADFAEGIGAAIEGTLAAKAVEPDDGKTSDGTGLAAIPTVECPNCGAMFSGHYCPNCGQKANTHRTLTAIAHDLIHGVLHLDGKLSHTLPLLAFTPGRLTRRYIEGERAKFVSPMSMFLFGVFAMFAVFQMVGLTTPTDLDFGGPARSLNAVGAAELERMEQEIEDMASDDPKRAQREQEMAALRGFVTSTQLSADEDGAEDGDKEGEPTLGNTLEFGWEEVTPEERLTGIAFIDNAIKKWEQNPGLMLYKVQANGYKFSWLLIPFSLPFVWLLFLWRREFKAYDHTVFITYSLSFMSLLFIALSLAAAAGLSGGWVVLAFSTLAPLHLYKHLKHSYGLSRFSTLWRFFLLSFSMLFIVLLFANALLLIGAF